ncbi:MAG: hypothetical protein ACXW2C_02330, partial [Acidimicrobiia bacterium]
DATAAVARFADDVRKGRFPSSDETYHMTDQMTEALDLYGDGAVPERHDGSVPERHDEAESQLTLPR